MVARDHRRGRGGLARQVLAVLAEAGEPLTPAQVQERLGGDLAYTTVMTVMSRLRNKGVLARGRAGRAYAYSLLQDPAKVTARGMHRLLDVEPDREAALARFVDDLSEADEQLLRDLLGGPGDPRPANGDRS